MPAYLLSDHLPVSIIAGALNIEGDKKGGPDVVQPDALPPALLLAPVYVCAGRGKSNGTPIYLACNIAALYV